MKTLLKISSVLYFVLTLSAPTAYAASCSITDVQTNLTVGGSANANACTNHTGNDAQINYENNINADFGLNLNWMLTDKNDAIGNLAISSGAWDFSNHTISNPFVIVLKAGNNFAAYLFNQGSVGTGFWGTYGIPTNGNNLIDISHISLYTTITTVGQVPVPAAIWLFAPALLGLLGFRRKHSA